MKQEEFFHGATGSINCHNSVSNLLIPSEAEVNALVIYPGETLIGAQEGMG